jgi:hypothetical protein
MSIKTEISVGEFLDKLTILQIKQAKIKGPDKLTNINLELDTLMKVWDKAPYDKSNFQDEILSLYEINLKLWDIEDKIRDKESRKEFDQVFIELARAVYNTNDLRANIKKQINQKSGSVLIEEKSYKDYK